MQQISTDDQPIEGMSLSNYFIGAEVVADPQNSSSHYGGSNTTKNGAKKSFF